jgi:hypothetical protein
VGIFMDNEGPSFAYSSPEYKKSRSSGIFC